MRKVRPSFIKPNSAGTKMQWSPVNLTLRTGTVEESDSLIQLSKMWKKKREGEGWLTSICVWMKASCSVFRSLEAQQTPLRGGSLGKPLTFCGLGNIFEALISALNLRMTIKDGNESVSVWK